MQTLACRLAPLGFFEFCRKAIGDTFTIYAWDLPPVVMLSNGDDIREMLAAPASVLHPGEGGQTLAPIVGNSSFMLQDEQEHLNGRREIVPAFGRGAAELHAEVIREIADDEIARWPLNTPMAIHPYLRRLTLRAILRLVFGGESDDLSRLRDRILDMLDVTVSFTLVEPRLRRLPGWRGVWRRFVRDRAEVDAVIAALIKRGRETRSRGGVLDALLNAQNLDGSSMSDRQVRDNIVSVIVAGHETTASELAWAFQLIAHNPRVKTRLTAEIDRAVEDTYLMATIAEVLRHRPVFLFSIPRVVVAPIVIGGRTYRPPAQLLGCIYLVQHDAAHYPDPQAFRPERFLEDGPDPQSWLPWGGGRKRCPGNRLASLEMSAVLRSALSEREIVPAGKALESASWRSVIVTPSEGSRVVLRTRN